MVHYSSYKLEEVEVVAQALAAVIVKSATSKYEVSCSTKPLLTSMCLIFPIFLTTIFLLQSVKKKYSNPKMMKVALRHELEADCLIRLSEGKSPFP